MELPDFDFLRHFSEDTYKLSALVICVGLLCLTYIAVAWIKHRSRERMHENEISLEKEKFKAILKASKEQNYGKELDLDA